MGLPVSPQRVLHVVNRGGDRGDGISNVCVDLACQQAAEGDVVAVATALGGFTPLLEEFGVQVTEIDFRVRGVRAALATLARLRHLVREFAPDIVHAHTLVATVVARAAVTGRRTTVVATVHNEYQRGVLLMSAAHRVVGVSAAVSAAMKRRRVPEHKIRTVLNGTVGSARRRAERTGPPAALDKPAVVAVGAVSHRKGADLLVEAAMTLAASHGAHTYFAGNIDWHEPRTSAENSPWHDNIHFLGFEEDPRRLLDAASVFVLASRRDPAPLVLIEAMEAGLPIVATSIDGVPEMLSHGAAGLLVAPDDAAALADGVQWLLDDESEKTRLADAARRRSCDLSVTRVRAEYAEIYAELRASSTSRPRSSSGDR